MTRFNELNANAMFNYLNYKKIATIDENDCIMYENEEDAIFIFPKTKEFQKQWKYGGIPKKISIKELQAIVQFYKELNILDEELNESEVN